jgi:hypothetical protein
MPVGFIASENSSEVGHGLCGSYPRLTVSSRAEFVRWRLLNHIYSLAGL